MAKKSREKPSTPLLVSSRRNECLIRPRSSRPVRRQQSVASHGVKACDGWSQRTRCPSGEGTLAAKLQESGVQVVTFPHMAVLKRRSAGSVGGFARLVWNFILSTIQLFRVAGRFQPDLVQSNSAAVLPAGIVTRIKRIPHLWHIREIFSDFPKVWIFYQWFIFAFSDRIVCVSQAVAEQFHPRIRSQKIVVLYDGIPASEFPNVSLDEIQAFRHKYNINGNLLVGLVGRIKIGRKG